MSTLGPANLTTENNRWWRRLAGVLRMTHFFPNVMVLTATLVLELVASRGTLEAGRLLTVWLVVLCGHCAIGITNDYLDRERDAIAQPYKPIPSGLVSAVFTRNLIIGLLLAEAVLAVTLGIGPALLALVATASGMLYNIYLKDSYLSWVPYLLSFTTLPLFIWAGLHQFEARLLWMYPPATLLFIGVNLANSLPDITSDQNFHQSKGLGHLLGLDKTLWVLRLIYLATPLLCLGMTWVVSYNRQIFYPVAIIAWLMALLTFLIFWQRRDRTSLVRIWQLLSGATFLVGVGLLAALALN